MTTSVVVDKYLRKSVILLNEGKTGLECEYCQNPKYHKKNGFLFCDGCGAQKPVLFGFIFGVPIYDADDFYPLATWGLVVSEAIK